MKISRKLTVWVMVIIVCLAVFLGLLHCGGRTGAQRLSFVSLRNTGINKEAIRAFLAEKNLIGAMYWESQNELTVYLERRQESDSDRIEILNALRNHLDDNKIGGYITGEWFGGVPANDTRAPPPPSK
jgi:hypothetical protein